MKRVALFLMLFSATLLLAQSKTHEIGDNQLFIEFELPEYKLTETDDFSLLSLQGGSYPEGIGAPAIPFLEYKVGIPSGASINISISEAEYSQVTLDKRLAPLPRIGDHDGISETIYEANETLYRPINSPLYELFEEESFRELCYIPFALNPFSYDGDKELKLLNKAKILITISGNTDQKSSPPQDAMTKVGLDTFLNKNQAKHWQSKKRATIHYADFSKSPWWMRVETDKHGMFKLEYSDLSAWPIQDIDPRTLRLFASSVDLIGEDATDPGHAFQELPIVVRGEEDGSFDPGDFIIFHGKDRTGTAPNRRLQALHQYVYHNPFSHNGVYWLTFAGDFDGKPLRIPETNFESPYTESIDNGIDIIHIEEERYRRIIHSQNWYMSRLSGSVTMDYDFFIDTPDLYVDPNPDPDPDAEPNPKSLQNIKLRLQTELEKTGNTHSISILVNDQIVVSGNDEREIFSWSGNLAFNFNEHTSFFQPGKNKVTIRVLRNNRVNNLLLDYIEVSYYRNNIKHDSQLSLNIAARGNSTPARYHISGDHREVKAYALTREVALTSPAIHAVDSGFEVIIPALQKNKLYFAKDSELYRPAKIAIWEPEDIASPTQPVESLIITPNEFLEQAEELAEIHRQKWGYSVKIVTQDAIIDQFNGGHPEPLAIRQYIRHVFHNFPAPKIQSVSLLGLGSIDWRNYSGMAANNNHIMIFENPKNLVSSDDYLAMITTNRGPEVALGRFPVHNKAELDIMLNNLRKYLFEPTPGHWQNSVLLLADDFVNGSVTNDTEHTISMQELSRAINPSMDLCKIFAAEYPPDEYQNKPRVRNLVFDEVNKGKLIWFYVGHGSFDVLGMQNYYTGSTDLGRFDNSGQLPLFIASSCDIALFYHWAYVSLAEKTVLLEDRGGIASVAATGQSWGSANQSLMMFFVPNMTNNYNRLGEAMVSAKLQHSLSTSNNSQFVIFGDPNLHIVPPQRTQSLDYADPDSKDDRVLDSREQVQLAGSFSSPALSGEAEFYVKDTEAFYMMGGIRISRPGNMLFKGKVSVSNSEFDAGFIVPDDTQRGSGAVAYSYIWDDASEEGYISYLHPISTSGQASSDSDANDGPPQIKLYLDSESYKDGDKVGLSPMLYAKISDENGINITGVAGHNILLSLDGSSQITSITDYFEYDLDSYTSGTVRYRLPQLDAGAHTLQLIVFDNYNIPSVATTNFIAQRNLPLKISDLLIYPNPIKDSGYITFVLTEDSEVEIDIFTMSGRKIRTIKTIGREGFNKVPFDARDKYANKLANNSYFVRLKAKSFSGKKGEKTETMVIYK